MGVVIALVNTNTAIRNSYRSISIDLVMERCLKIADVRSARFGPDGNHVAPAPKDATRVLKPPVCQMFNTTFLC